MSFFIFPIIAKRTLSYQHMRDYDMLLLPPN